MSSKSETSVPSAQLPAKGGTDVEAPSVRPRDFRTSKPAVPNRHWVRNDPFATALFNAFSAVFPHGETFMIRSIKPWQKDAPPKLAEEIRNFVEQEAAHSREHGEMNKSLTEAGYDVAPLEKPIRQFVAFFRNKSARTRLGATMCIEHFTAIIAAEILANDSHLAESEPELRELWLWHGLEEVEHKAVAFDVWHHATREWSAMRRYLVRISLLAAVTLSFLINRTRGQMELLRQDGYSSGAAFRGLMAFGFGRGGVGRNIFRPWLAFFRPGFHPWDIDDRALIAKGELMVAKIANERAKALMPAERRKKARLRKAA